MTTMEKARVWISTFSRFGELADFWMDYHGQEPADGGMFPSGLVELERHRDIMGNTSVVNQHNIGLYFVFAPATGDNIGSEANVDWLMEFQEWVQEQSARGQTPSLCGGEQETVRAEGGRLCRRKEDGTATYMARLIIEFKERYEV